MIKVLIPPKDKHYDNNTKYNYQTICSFCGARQ